MTARALPGLAPLLVLMERAHKARPDIAAGHFTPLFAAATRTPADAASLKALGACIESLTGQRPEPAPSVAPRLPDDAFPALSHVLDLVRLAHTHNPIGVGDLFDGFIGACEQAGVDAQTVRLLRWRGEVLAGRREETRVVLHGAEGEARSRVPGP